VAQERREIAFDVDVLRAAEEHAGGELSAFVNAAVRRALPAPAPAGAAAGELREQYLAAMLARDARAGQRLVEAAYAAGVPAIELYADVLAPALHEVGHRWALEELNVAEEHFVTTATQALIAALARDGRPAPSGGRLAVVSATPGERHLLGAQMVADLLEREGWEVLELGADTPADDLTELVGMDCPDLVALSTSTAGRLPGLADVLARLDAVRPRPLIAVGGGLFTAEAAATAEELGADLVLPELRAFLAELRRRFPPPAG
jgi:methanogenic corrinoid protein MtbC1